MTHIQQDIKTLAANVFGDKSKADAWLNTPVKALNNQTPTSMLNNDKNIEKVKALLRKISSGEFT